jgi:hypothetical protein
MGKKNTYKLPHLVFVANVLNISLIRVGRNKEVRCSRKAGYIMRDKKIPRPNKYKAPQGGERKLPRKTCLGTQGVCVISFSPLHEGKRRERKEPRT